MRCLGRTRSLERCRNPARWFVCHKHRLQPWALIASVVTIVGLVAGLYQDLWRPIFTRCTEPPIPEVIVEITTMPSKYAPGLVVQDVTWRESFQEYRVVIKRQPTGTVVRDVQVHLNLPAPVISRAITAHRFADGLNFVEANHESTGALVSKQNVSRELFTWYNNHLNICISRLGRDGSVDIAVILDFKMGADFDGFVATKYDYESVDGLEHVAYWHPIIRSGDLQRALEVDIEKRTGRREAILILAPKEQIRFKANGAVEIEKKEEP